MIPRYYIHILIVFSKNYLIDKEQNEIGNWYKANKLSVNTSKTNYMILGTAHITNTFIDLSKYWHDDDKNST